MNIFNNFINSFYVHFGIHKNFETIPSINELLSDYPKHILIIKIENLNKTLLEQNLSPYDFMMINDLLDFDDNSEKSLTEYFNELKTHFNKIKKSKFQDITIVYSEKHKEYKKQISRIKNTCLLNYPTFTLLTIKIPENLLTKNNIQYIFDSLIIFKKKVRDTLSFIILNKENESQLLFIKSPKTPTSRFSNYKFQIRHRNYWLDSILGAF